MFVATANILNIPGPLLDRMEVIRSGGTPRMKRSISRSVSAAQADEASWTERELKSRSPNASARSSCATTRAKPGYVAWNARIAKICRKVVKELLQKPASDVRHVTRNLEKYWASSASVTALRDTGPGRTGHRPGVDGSGWRSADD